MTAAANQPPRHNRRFRDYAKLEKGKNNFNALCDAACRVGDLSDAALDAALYYASDEVTGAVGTNKIRKVIRAEAKKRGLRVA